MIEVTFADIEIVETFLKYDIPLKGICRYQKKLYQFTTVDKTDYEKMQSECPYCSSSKDSIIMMDECTCQSYVDVVCQLTPLTFVQKIKRLFTFSKS